jgi:hypothetical protein
MDSGLRRNDEHFTLNFQSTKSKTPPQRGFACKNQGHRYSGLAPDSLTTLAHFLISDWM